jgi:sugar (pentulose or hexulose) kinase
MARQRMHGNDGLENPESDENQHPASGKPQPKSVKLDTPTIRGRNRCIKNQNNTSRRPTHWHRETHLAECIRESLVLRLSRRVEV